MKSTIKHLSIILNDCVGASHGLDRFCVMPYSKWLDGKHGVGVPESEPRSRSPGVGVPESDVIKIWKTRSHMENTESYGKHGV